MQSRLKKALKDFPSKGISFVWEVKLDRDKQVVLSEPGYDVTATYVTLYTTGKQRTALYLEIMKWYLPIRNI